MDDERMTMKEFKREARKVKIKRTIDDLKMKVANRGQWIWDHKVEIGAGIATTVGLATKAVKLYSRLHNAHLEHKKERTIYDPSLHKTVELKHKLSNKQVRELSERISNGEKRHDIIQDMGLLK